MIEIHKFNMDSVKMRARVLLLTIAFLGVIIVGFSSNFNNVANGAIIFSDNFQNGNLNAWTQFRGTLTINNQTTNNGEPYSVQSIVPGGTIGNLYYHTLPSIANPMDLRMYVYVNTTTVPSANGDYYQVGGFSTNGGPNFGDGELIVTNVNGALYWGIFYRDLTNPPNGFSRQISTSNSTSTAVPVSIGWTCIELRELVGTSGQGNGYEQLYINGTLIVNAQNVWNFDRTPYNVIIGGSQSITNPTETFNYYMADVVVSDSYVGLNQNLLTTSTNFGTISPSNITYAEGQQVIITTTPPASIPGERYVWQGWTGNGPGSYSGLGSLSGDGVSYTASVTMNGNVTEMASWKHQYQLIIVSPYGNAIGNQSWVDAGTTSYAAITPTTVSGTTGTQYVFTNWSGDASGSSSPSNAIVMDSPKTAIASWKTQFYLNVTSPYGIVSGMGWYDSGNVGFAALNASTIPGAIGTQYLFTSWGGDATGTNYTQSDPITMDAPKNAATNWQTQYSLTIAQSGVSSDYSSTVLIVNGTNYNWNGYSTWANASDRYSFGYTSQLVVLPNSKQYILTGISGNSTSSPIMVTQPITVTGAYKTQYYFNQTSANGTPSPSNGWFDNGTSIQAYVASPIPGNIIGEQYVCSGWSGTGSVPASGSASVATFSITAQSTIAWNWQTQFQVSFVTTPALGGSTTPSGTNVWVNQGALSISASPAYTYSFSGWSATGNIQFNYAGSASTFATIGGPGTITASFSQTPTPTPTPVPIQTPTPTPTLKPSPTPTHSTSPTITATPTATPTQANSNTILIYGVVIAVVIIAAVAGAVLYLRKRKKP